MQIEEELRATKIATDMMGGVGIGGHLPDACDGQHCWHLFADEDDGPCCYCGEEYREGIDAYCPVGDLARAIVETP